MIVRIGLLVTGKGEREFLEKFFVPLQRHAHVTVKVLRKVEQLSAITSPKRLKVTGTPRGLATKAEESIAFPAKTHLRENANSLVILIDDLERREPEPVFGRYRAILDTVLRDDEQQRASVHFLVKMLEAYYFAHAEAVNSAAERVVLESDCVDDPESIGHPKEDLKALWKGFDERSHGQRVVDRLDMVRVLSNPSHCCWLRSMFKWCFDRLKESSHPQTVHTPFPDDFLRMDTGCVAPLTYNQRP